MQHTLTMKTIIFLALVASSSAVLLRYSKEMTYEGKVQDFLTEEAVGKLCSMLMSADNMEEEQMPTGTSFYNVNLPQTRGAMKWFTRGTKRTAIGTLEYKTGCYKWEMRPCYGFYPNSFSHPCTFWMPLQFPGGKCMFDFDGTDPTMIQQPVTLNGRAAAQLCDTSMQAMNKDKFSMKFIPLNLNLPSDFRCKTYKYTPAEEGDGKWDMEPIPQAECDTKYPEMGIEELEDPEMAMVECLPSINGEYECFFDDQNMPVDTMITIQNKPTTADGATP